MSRPVSGLGRGHCLRLAAAVGLLAGLSACDDRLDGQDQPDPFASAAAPSASPSPRPADPVAEAPESEAADEDAVTVEGDADDFYDDPDPADGFDPVPMDNAQGFDPTPQGYGSPGDDAAGDAGFD